MYTSRFASYYDDLMGDYSSITSLTKKLVNQYIPRNGSILELGCGTGNILKLFQKEYTIAGLDNSEGMLVQAKKKLPRASLTLADMTTFSLPQTFNGILCIFDTINHLTGNGEWEKVFRRVKKHLKKDGIFIFDINTPRRLQTLAEVPAQVVKLDKNTLAKINISQPAQTLFTIEFELFENILSPQVTFLEEKVSERAYDRETVVDMLNQDFTILRMIDPIRKRISPKTGRIFFVCKRK